MGIYSKLATIQKELKAPKGQYNSFGKYKYRSCEDIQESVKPLLSKVGAVLVITDDIVNIGTRFYVKATAQIIDIETGETVSNTAFAREDESKKGMDGSQVTGASSSYARKYALNGLLCIDDTNDADATNDHGKASQNASQGITEQQKSDLIELCKRKGFNPDTTLNFSKAWDEKKYNECVAWFNAKPDKEGYEY